MNALIFATHPQQITTMMRHTDVNQHSAGKRKRIPLDPNLQQGYPNKKEEVPVPGDLYQKRQDDIDPDTIHQNRITARSEEELKKTVLPQRGIE